MNFGLIFIFCGVLVCTNPSSPESVSPAPSIAKKHPREYKDFLEQLYRSNPETLPRVYVHQFSVQFPQGGMSDHQIKNWVHNRKTKGLKSGERLPIPRVASRHDPESLQ